MPFDLDKVVNEYRENGYVSGLPVLSKYEARKLQNYIVELEKKFSKDEDVKIFITSVKKSSRGIHR